MGCPPEQEECHKSGPVKLQECPGLSKTNSNLSLNVAGQRNPHIWLNRAFPPSGSLVWTNRGSAWHCSAPAGYWCVVQASQTHQESPNLRTLISREDTSKSVVHPGYSKWTSVANLMLLKENNGIRVLFGDPWEKTLMSPWSGTRDSLSLFCASPIFSVQHMNNQTLDKSMAAEQVYR